MAAWVGPAIVAAFISALVTAIGWYVGHRQDVRREAAKRIERIRDVQTAILAEIRANRHRLHAVDLEAHAALVAAKMNADPAFTPFVPREVPAFLIDALMGEIHILPTGIIDPVILYYRQALTLSQLADDLRSERFEKLETNRKVELYNDYIGLMVYARTLADRAIDALDSSLAVNGS
jgi:hypothetical protein